MFNLAPIYSARKSSNHKLSHYEDKSHKLCVQQEQMSKLIHFQSHFISPLNNISFMHALRPI